MLRYKTEIAAIGVVLFSAFASVAGNPSAWDACPRDGVVLSVNGTTVTKGEFGDYQRMMIALYRNRHPSANAEKMRTIKARVRYAAKAELISMLLMYSNLCAGTNKVDVLESAQADLKKEYQKAFCARGQTFEQLREAMVDEGVDGCFDRTFKRDVEVRSALVARYPATFSVTAQELTNAVDNVKAYNAAAAATNAFICMTMTNVLKRVRAGEDFAKMANDFSQDPSRADGGDLGECDAATFGSDEVEYIAAVAALKPGEISDILATDDGYEIVRKLEDIGKDKSQSGNPSWRLARIFFRRPYLMPELEGKELVEDILKSKKASLLEDLVPRYQRAARIEFPAGDIFMKSGNGKTGKPKKTKGGSK